MEWITNLVIALLLTDITGTIFLVIGVVLGETCFQSHVGWKRLCLKLVLLFYTVPFLYGLWCVQRKLTMAAWGEVRAYVFFYVNNGAGRVACIVGSIYLAILSVLVVQHLHCYLRWRRVCMGNIPEEDAALQERFDEICERLGLTGQIALCRNDLVEVPCFTKCGGPAVVLPLAAYREEEINLILYHELCHFKEKDMRLKTWCMFVKLIHGFNPAVHFLFRWVTLVCEESCDQMVCGDESAGLRGKQYFQIIFNMLRDGKQKERTQLFALFDTKLNYERRVLCMKKKLEGRRMKRSAVLGLSVCFIIGSSMTAYAAGDALADSYERLVEETTLYVEEEAQVQELQEYVQENGLDPDSVVMMETNSFTRGTSNFEWDIPAGKTYMTAGFQMEEDDEIAIITQATPDDLEYSVGISDRSTRRYVTGTDMISHTFVIKESKRYYVFVQNESEEELHVEGTYLR